MWILCNQIGLLFLSSPWWLLLGVIHWQILALFQQYALCCLILSRRVVWVGRMRNDIYSWSWWCHFCNLQIGWLQVGRTYLCTLGWCFIWCATAAGASRSWGVPRVRHHILLYSSKVGFTYITVSLYLSKKNDFIYFYS